VYCRLPNWCGESSALVGLGRGSAHVVEALWSPQVWVEAGIALPAVLILNKTEEILRRTVGMLAGGDQPVYASDECEIDLARRELRVLGSPVPVGGRAFEIIEVLAQSAGELVTKYELMNRVWPGAIVMENTLQVHAAAVRKALGPYRGLLKTESGRGYRLLGDWTVRHRDAAKPPVGFTQIRVTDELAGTNFPAAVTPLIGRSAAQQRLHDLVSAYRVVTLTGPGGIGETALALEVARSVVGEFADGGWLVDLASLSDPDLVPSAVAGALRLRLGADIISPEAVARAIAEKKLLLVLDIVNTSSMRQRRWPKHSYGCAHALRSWRPAAKFCGSRANTPTVSHHLKCPQETRSMRTRF
jgi:DNA-binding winged helix-turn-helix (wHTH) protein